MVKGGARSADVMSVYALLAGASFTFFGLLHLLQEHNITLGYMELAAAGAVGLIMLGLRLGVSAAVARTCLLLIMMVLIAVMLVTGGTQGTGIFWCFMFPVAAFFLAGTRDGLVWMGIFLGAIGLLWAGAQTTLVTLYYPNITIRQLLVTLCVVAYGLYVYQRSREHSDARATRSQRELKANLKDTTEQHRQLNHAKSEFVTLSSHQLRTPISAIGWYSEMLLNGEAGHLSSTQSDAIRSIKDSNYRLSLIVDAMLTVSSLELNALYVRPEPTDLAGLTRKVVKETGELYADKKLVIHQHYDDLPKLNLDDAIMKQMIRNLVANACKYTPPHGTITVHVIKKSEKLTPDSAGSVLITVSDNGYGIPAAQQPNVFAKMFRADNIKSKDTDGTGLGLFIVKALTDLVGGRVSFVSQEGKGSLFAIQLPLEGMQAHGGATAAEGIPSV